MKFYFIAENQTFYLPVNPAELEVVKDGNNETIDVIGLGEVNILKPTSLTSITIECYFPKNSSHPAVLTKGSAFKSPSFYVNFFEKLRKNKGVCRLTVSDTPINMMVSIENFTKKYVAQDDDLHYMLELKEYVRHTIATVSLSKSTTSSTTKKATANKTTAKKTQSSRENVAKAVTVGCNVIVNGRLHRDSYGNGPGATRKNYKGKVNFIKKGRSHPYHITTPSGGWQGWVTAKSVKVV